MASLRKHRRTRMSGVVIGLFIGFDDEGEALVDYPDNPTSAALTAKVIGTVGVQDKGREAALLFEGGHPARPVLVGLIEDPDRRTHPVPAPVVDEILDLKAQKRIVLGCGDASITLTRAGKVVIRGRYVLSSSSGANLVKGGVIRLN